MGRCEQNQDWAAGSSNCPLGPSLQDPTVGTGEGGASSPKRNHPQWCLERLAPSPFLAFLIQDLLNLCGNDTASVICFESYFIELPTETCKGNDGLRSALETNRVEGPDTRNELFLTLSGLLLYLEICHRETISPGGAEVGAGDTHLETRPSRAVRPGRPGIGAGG